MRLRLRSFGIDYVAVHDSLAVSVGVLDGGRDLAELLVQRAMGDVLEELWSP